MNNLPKNRIFLYFLGGLILYLASAGISYASFRYLLAPSVEELISPVSLEEQKSKISLTGPKTEACPLNGGMFTKPESQIWSERRPLTVVIENHEDARPQSGLSKADIVYEAVAEGGITRFLGVFYCGVAAGDLRLAPVRSARVHFIDWAAEYGDKPIFLHVGGSNNFCPQCPNGVKPVGNVAKEVRAIELLESLGWRGRGGNDFDLAFDVGYPILWRDYERLGRPLATEHTVVASTEETFKEAAKRGFKAESKSGDLWSQKFVSWNFSDDKPVSENVVSNIKFEFWKGKSPYEVEWKYNSEKNEYQRFNGSQPHTDLEDGSQIVAKNVAIMFVIEKGPVDKEGHLLYTTVGGGEALIFQNGTVVKGNWKKESRTSRTRFFDKSGKEVSFVRGAIWIEVLPAGREVSFQ